MWLCGQNPKIAQIPKLFIGFLVFWLLGFFLSKFQSSKVYKFQGFIFSEFRSFKFIKKQSVAKCAQIELSKFEFSKFQSSYFQRKSMCRSYNVPIFPTFEVVTTKTKVSEFPNYNISECQLLIFKLTHSQQQKFDTRIFNTSKF